MTHSSGVICRGVECEPLKSKRKAISREIESIKPAEGNDSVRVTFSDKPAYFNWHLLLAAVLVVAVVAGIWSLTTGNSGSTGLNTFQTPSTIPHVSSGSSVMNGSPTHGLTMPSSPANDLLPPSAK
jgi:hypothetical protein